MNRSSQKKPADMSLADFVTGELHGLYDMGAIYAKIIRYHKNDPEKIEMLCNKLASQSEIVNEVIQSVYQAARYGAYNENLE